MGEVIRPSAAADDILADARDAVTNATAKGGVAKKLADEHLGPVLAMVDVVEADYAKTDAVLKPLKAELGAENDRADAEVARVYDDVWNDVGRPASDRYLSLMFPGGAGFYTDGDVTKQPQRMELLARFFDKRIHPKLTEEQSTAYAARIRAAAKDLKADVKAIEGPSDELELLGRTHTALARVVQGELVSLKRSYKNAGMSESDIHTIIPDRPTAKKKAKPAKEGEGTAPEGGKKVEEGKKPEEPAKPQ